VELTLAECFYGQILLEILSSYIFPTSNLEIGEGSSYVHCNSSLPQSVLADKHLLPSKTVVRVVNLQQGHEAESTTRIRDLSCMPPTVTRITGGVPARLLQLLATSAITIGHPARIPQAPLYGYDPAAEPVKAISPSLTAWIRQLLLQDHAVLLPAPGPFSYFLHFISHLSF
jgi:hypothetical protein